MAKKSLQIHDVGMLKKQKWFPEFQDCISKGMDKMVICRKFGITRQLYQAYMSASARKELAKEMASEQRIGADLYAQKLDIVEKHCQKAIEACDEWLSDPDHPEKYTFAPRAQDFDLIYLATEYDEEGKPYTVRKKENFQHVLSQIRQDTAGAIDPQQAVFKGADPWKVLLDSLRLAKDNVESIAKIMGVIHDIQVSVDVQGVIVPTIVNIMLDATVDAPIVRQRLMDKMEELSSSLRTGGVA